MTPVTATRILLVGLVGAGLVGACRTEAAPSSKGAPPSAVGSAALIDAGALPACGGPAKRAAPGGAAAAGVGRSAEASRTNDELIATLGGADANARTRALGELVRRGSAATSALYRALDTPDVELRARLVRALAEIADPSCADLYEQLVSDTDPRNRAYAAHALARIHDPRALDALVRTIDDNPDVLHDPETLATYALATMGPVVLPKLAPLLSAPDEMTRVRAFHVIQQVVSALPHTRWEARWRELGSYDPRGPAPQREQAAKQWRDWIARQRFPGG